MNFDDRKVLKRGTEAVVFLPRVVNDHKMVLVHKVYCFDGSPRGPEELLGRKAAERKWAELTSKGWEINNDWRL